MRVIQTLALSLCVLFFISACVSPRGASRNDKRAAVREMRDEALAKLYAEVPSTRQIVEGAAGYAVFSSISSKIFVVASGAGYGIAVDPANGEETFMRMVELGGGVGFGLTDIRQVLAFRTRSAFQHFLEAGLEVGGDADVSLKSGDRGAAVAVSENVTSLTTGDVRVFQITRAGASAAAVVTAAKYYRDDRIN